MTMETVSVACKLPNGLKCRVFAPREEQELVMGGGTRTVTRYYPTGDVFVLNGTAAAPREAPKARLPNGMPGPGNVQMLDSGFALTFGVPKHMWEAWLEQNRAADYVKNGLVFADEQGASVKRQAKDHEAVTSGLEPVDPDRPGAEIEPTDEMKKRLRAGRLKAA